MFNKFERIVAFRYLFPRRKKGFLSIIAGFCVLGIMLGVATLIVVMSVMNGFHKEILKKVIGINAHISITHNTGKIQDYERFAENLGSLPNIHNASPMVQGQVLASANKTHRGVMVRGMSLEDLKNKALISDNIIMGDFWDDKDAYAIENSVIIGSQMSRTMHLLPGDIIRLISPQTSTTFFGDMPRIKDYTVTAVFDVGMIEYDSNIIFMPIKAAQIYFKIEDGVNSIEVNLREANQIDKTKNDILMRLGGNFNLIDWKQVNSSFFNSIKVETNVMFLILSLIILIATFNIISGMIMLVNNKSKEVAILRTIGASKGSILRIFIFSGTLIGVVGTALGYIIGVGFAKNIQAIRKWIESWSDTNLFDEQVYFLSKLPSDVQNVEVYGVAIMSISLSILATLYPAYKATKISPVQGLSNE